MKNMSPSGFVTIAKVVKAHGLQGEVCITSFADSPFLLADVARLYVAEKGRHPRKVTLDSLRPHGNGLLLQLHEVKGREQARELVGRELMVRRRDLPELEPEEVLIADVIGLEVLLPDRRPVGRVAAADVVSGREIWTIQGPGGQEILFPVVDQFVLEISLETRQAVIDPPPGLLETYGWSG